MITKKVSIDFDTDAYGHRDYFLSIEDQDIEISLEIDKVALQRLGRDIETLLYDEMVEEFGLD